MAPNRTELYGQIKQTNKKKLSGSKTPDVFGSKQG